MATQIIMQGGDIEVREKFETVRRNFDSAIKAKVDYENGNIDGVTRGSEGAQDQRYNPMGRCTFHQEDGTLVSVNPEKLIALVNLDSE